MPDFNLNLELNSTSDMKRLGHELRKRPKSGLRKLVLKFLLRRRRHQK